MEDDREVQVPWQFTRKEGHPQIYAMAVKLYLASVANRLLASKTAKLNEIIADDMFAFHVLEADDKEEWGAMSKEMKNG